MSLPILITADRLRDLCPQLAAVQAETHVAALNPALNEWTINTPRRIAAFLAQIAHETGGFQHLRELGDTHYLARYEGRKSLGNLTPGDGPRFRGRGYIQITGRANYSEAAYNLDLPLLENPVLAETPRHAARIAGWFWHSRGLNGMADEKQFSRITKKINGGLNGIDQRRRYWETAKRLWPEE